LVLVVSNFVFAALLAWLFSVWLVTKVVGYLPKEIKEAAGKERGFGPFAFLLVFAFVSLYSTIISVMTLVLKVLEWGTAK
jgi:hypothetical protein